jgi:hypothetical protein
MSGILVLWPHFNARHGAANVALAHKFELSIVIAALSDFELLVGSLARDSIDEAMFAADATRPPAGIGTTQWFRFANP